MHRPDFLKSSSGISPKHINIAEHAGRRRMADADHLVWLALAAVRRAQDFDGVGVADGAEVLPEVCGNRPVIRVLDHAFKLAVLDQLTPLATELELVARIVDGPGTVGAHQNAVFDIADQLLQRLIAGLDIQVGHAIDRRTVPAAGATVGDTVHVGTELRQRAAQWTQQQAFFDQKLFARGGTVVVMTVAGKLLGNVRVEGYVEQFGAVLQAAEVFCLDETGAGVIALVAEDTVQFQRVADGFVDLQHHLVRHQQQVARALWRVRRQQQLQRLIGDFRAGADQAAAADHIKTALLTEVLAAQGASLAIAAVVGGDFQARVDETLGLAQFGAGAAEVDLLDVGDADADLPVHQSLVLRHGSGFGAE